MEGHDVFSYPYKRSIKEITLASFKSITVSEDRSIDRALLFQRLLALSKSGNNSLNEVLTHDLSPYPPALFEANNLMLQADKTKLQADKTKLIDKRSCDIPVYFCCFGNYSNYRIQCYWWGSCPPSNEMGRRKNIQFNCGWICRVYRKTVRPCYHCVWLLRGTEHKR